MTTDLAPHHWRPGDPRASAAGKKSGEVRKARREAEQASRALEQAESKAALEAFLSLDLHDVPLAVAARNAALLVIKRVVLDRIPVRNGAEAAQLIEKLHAIARLEEGESTSARTVTVRIDDAERRARIEQVRQAIEVTGRRVTSSLETVTPQVPGPPLPAEGATPPADGARVSDQATSSA